MKRQIVALLVMLGLSFQGLAAFTFERAHCPMQAMSASGEDMPTDLPECCNDPATYDATGQSCKSGAGCSLPGAMGYVTILGATVIHCSSCPLRAAESPIRAAPIPPPWRPPSLV